MPVQTIQLTGELQTLLTTAAFAPIEQAFLLITGSDATRWLNGMVTNSIQALGPGEGNYNFLLNAQGRIQGDCTIYRELDATTTSFLLETRHEQMPAIQTLLDKFIIMDDVELIPAHGGQQTLELLGPNVPATLAALNLPDLPPARLAHLSAPQGPGLLLTPADLHTPRLKVHGAPDVLQALKQRLTQADLQEASADTLEQLRILEARPRYGTDIRNTDAAKDLPQETNQPHALHFSKGCYLGQEIVERIRSRGQVHRQFTPFRLEGTPPFTFPAPLEANGKPAGELTSAIAVPTTEGDLWLALGYARREFLEAGTPLTYAGGKAYPRSPGKLT